MRSSRCFLSTATLSLLGLSLGGVLRAQQPTPHLDTARGQVAGAPVSVQKEGSIDLSELHTRLDAIEKLEDRTWDVVWGLAGGVILVIVGGGFTLWMWPRRVMRSAQKRISDTLGSRLGEIEKHLDAHREASKAELHELASRLEALLRSETVALTGRVLYSDGSIDEAIDLLSDHLAHTPDHARALFYRGLSYKRKGRHFGQQAIADLTAAVAQKEYSGDAPAHYALAEALFNAGHLDDAENSVQRSLELGFRNRALALTMLGDCLRRRAVRTRDHDLFLLAIKQYDQCLTDAARWHTPAIEGKILSLESLGRIDEAIETAEEPTKAGHPVANYYLHAARLKWNRNDPGDRAAARDSIRTAQKLNPRDTNVWLREGLFLLSEANDVTDETKIIQLAQNAVTIITKARDLAAASFKPALRVRLCEALFRSGRHSDAVHEAETAAREAPSHVNNRLTLATVYLATRRWEAASTEAYKASDLASSPPYDIMASTVILIAEAAKGVSFQKLVELETRIKSLLVSYPDFRYSRAWLAKSALVAIQTIRPGLLADAQGILQNLETNVTSRVPAGGEDTDAAPPGTTSPGAA